MRSGSRPPLFSREVTRIHCVGVGGMGVAPDGSLAVACANLPDSAETGNRSGEAPRSSLRYHFPNIMELAIDPGGRIMRLLAICSPAEAGTTRLTIYTIRNFARLRLFDPLFARANRKIAEEDRAILESSLPLEVPPAGEEHSVASDAPTLAFRKIWFTRIKPGSVDRRRSGAI